MVERKIGDKVIRLVREDITELDLEAFVFDITPDKKLGAGFGGAIQQRGGIVIQKELDAIDSCKTGEAVLTEAGILKAKYIIHANGPKFREPDEEGKLMRTTQAALEIAAKKGFTQLAFPPIGTGLYQVPMELCARVMINTVCEHLRGETSLTEVTFAVPDTREYQPFSAQIDKLQEGV